MVQEQVEVDQCQDQVVLELSLLTTQLAHQELANRLKPEPTLRTKSSSSEINVVRRPYFHQVHQLVLKQHVLLGFAVDQLQIQQMQVIKCKYATLLVLLTILTPTEVKL